jgi:hypothetical protein
MPLDASTFSAAMSGPRKGSPATIAANREPCRAGYALKNMWTGEQSTTSDGTITQHVPAQGVALLEVTSLSTR